MASVSETSPTQARSAAEVARAAERDDVRRRWMLSAPALSIIGIAALGPLMIVMVYSFLQKDPYGGVIWAFSLDAWFNVFLQRDIFDDTLGFADAHLSIFWRSVRLSFLTTLLALLIGFPTAYFIATRPKQRRAVWLRKASEDSPSSAFRYPSRSTPTPRTLPRRGGARRRTCWST